MNKMTAQEIITFLKDNNISNNNFNSYAIGDTFFTHEDFDFEDEEGNEYTDEDYKKKQEEYTKIIGKINIVEEIGGYDGEGDLWEVVYHLLDHNIYLKAEGYYSSWGESTLNDNELYEVFPKEVLVIKYESKEK